MSADEQRILRSGKRTAPASETTPSTGETTSASTNTWSKGTGNTERQNEDISTHVNTATVDHVVEDRTARRTSAPATVVNVPANTESSHLSVLLAELELRNAEVAQAQAASAVAKSRLEIARVEAAHSASAASVQGERETRVSGWVNHQLSVNDRTEIRVREPSRGIDVNARAPVEFENRDLELLSSRVEAAVSRSRNAPIVQRHVAELPHFDGDITEWIAFKAEFLDTESMFSDVANVGRIRRSLRGDARYAVKSILYTVTDPNEILDMLEMQFGNPEAIVMAEIEEVKRLPRLADDGHNITMFAGQVANVVATIKTLRQEQYLLAPELVNRLVDKLNLILRHEWNKYRVANASVPGLVALSTFLNETSRASGITRRPTTRARHNVHVVKRGGSSPPPSRSPSRSSERYQREDRDRRQDHERKNTSKHTKAQVKRVVKDTKRKPKPSPKPTREQDTSKTCTMCNGEHSVEKCADFLKLGVSDRWAKAKEFKLCFRCLNTSHRRPIRCAYVPCGMNSCEAAHHKLLHGCSRDTQARGNVSVNHLQRADTYLKIVPVEISGPLGAVEAHALLDEGSTMTLIERHVADQIAPRGSGEPLTLEGVGGNLVTDDRSCHLKLSIRGACSRNLEKVNAYTIDQLHLGSQSVARETVDRCEHLESISSELCYDKATPSILIGQDNWHLIVSRQLRSGVETQPVASLTKLGWVIHGQMTKPRRLVGAVNHVKTNDEHEALELIKQHFSIESLGVEPRTPKSDPDRRALDILNATCSKIPNEDRYEAGLLWKSDHETLPHNRNQALNRLFSLERKLDRNANLKQEYSKQIANLLQKGYAEKVEEPMNSDRGWYLPHFAVTHPQKQKVRLVFDAAAKTCGKSLNDALLTGPDLLQSLFGVLIRFREGKIAVVADIREMFLQIRMISRDRDSLRFLWRGEDRLGPVQEYRMTSLIFGSASSPSTAIFVKNRNAECHAAEYPHVEEATVKSFYVDDLLASFDDPREARELVRDIDKVHRRASFELRGWASNDPAVIADVAATAASESTELGKGDCERTLGLLWNHKRDTLTYNVNFRNTPPETLHGDSVPTKRQVTSGVMSLFDPVGLISPLTIVGKVLIQDVWRSGIGWDEAISPENHATWRSFICSMKQLEELELDRFVPTRGREVEFHTFCDASEKVYAAAVYAVGSTSDGSKCATLVAAKARVAPIKNVSIPRLELQAAVLGCRLTESVKRESSYDVSKSTYWTDSKTVLAWIRADPRTFKCFVAHRLAEIEDTTSPADWRWVPTGLNVADDATRGTPPDFDKTHRWFRGPDFITLPEALWPIETQGGPAAPPSGEERTPKVLAISRRAEEFEFLPTTSRFSKYKRLLRASAFVLLSAEAFKAKMLKRSHTKEVSPEHLKTAELLLIKRSQKESFAEEIRLLEAGRPLPKKSPLHKLAVKMNRHGILLLDGRIDRNQSTPVLHAKEPLTRLIINHYHAVFNHGNHATVMNELQKNHHIVGLRGALRYVSNSCQWCRTYRGTPHKLPLGDLPAERLQANQPAFTATACDYFGPMHVTIGRRHEKRWGVLFTCLTTRAVHLELAASLSSSSMILALRRMMARRGEPTVIYSDNGTNFVGAEREIAEAKAAAISMQTFATQKLIKWKRIPPGNPSAGGAWERLVGSVKAALRVTLHEQHPPEEVLHTLLLEAEHIINSRPLTPVILNEREEALTPNHFLIGRSNAMSPFGSFSDVKLTAKSWKTAQALADSFWSRWIREYRPTLRPRVGIHHTHEDIKTGDIVLIMDSTMPRGTWPRGEVVKTHPGPDGRVRVTEVRTAAGHIRRPASRLIPISSLNTVLAHAGENVVNR